MRRGRKCHFGNCKHNEGDRKTGHRCKFFSMPKDPIKTGQWLQLGGVYHLTPKRITPHNCFFCSCHFPNGKESGPEEFIEEWDDPPNEDGEHNFTRKRSQVTGTQESPAVKNRRVASLTPSTRLALDGLMLLSVDQVSPAPKSARFSPRKVLWKLRGTQARSSCRRTLCEMMMPTHRSIGIQCNRSFLSYDKCKKLPEKEFMFYTGVTQRVFEIIYTFVGGDEVCNKLKYEYRNHTPKIEHTNPDLTSKDKMFLTLLRLRRGLPLADLKIVFNISTSHASRIAYTWIRFLSLQFSKLDRHMFTSASAQNALKPKCFEEFPNLRIVIDATEFKIQHPRHFQHQNNTFSHYKKGSTMKFLVGISCFGGLSFLSEGYEGSMTDRKLVIASGLLDFLEPGDAVMADRGFDIEDLCDEKEVHLLIPAFQDGRTHFTARELIFNRAIAVSRIHVETFIGKIKNFRLIRYVIPNKMLSVASDIVKVCAYLVNFQLPFIKDDDPEFD